MSYLCNRADIRYDEITDQEAARIFAKASKDTASLLRGALRTGFTFWTLSRIHEGLRLVSIRIDPLPEGRGHEQQAATTSEM